MGVGIPGAGKTTALKPFAEKYSYTYISPDDIRGELTGNGLDQSKNEEVWQEAHHRVVESLKRRETVVFDATFARDEERKKFIQFAREHGAEKVHGVFAAVPYDVANERNKNRERVVPEHAMERMYGMLKDNPPVVEDGFDSVFDMNEFQELMRIEKMSEDKTLTKEFGVKVK